MFPFHVRTLIPKPAIRSLLLLWTMCFPCIFRPNHVGRSYEMYLYDYPFFHLGLTIFRAALHSSNSVFKTGHFQDLKQCFWDNQGNFNMHWYQRMVNFVSCDKHYGYVGKSPYCLELRRGWNDIIEREKGGSEGRRERWIKYGKILIIVKFRWWVYECSLYYYMCLKIFYKICWKKLNG